MVGLTGSQEIQQALAVDASSLTLVQVSQPRERGIDAYRCTQCVRKTKPMRFQVVSDNNHECKEARNILQYPNLRSTGAACFDTKNFKSNQMYMMGP